MREELTEQGREALGDLEVLVPGVPLNELVSIALTLYAEMERQRTVNGVSFCMMEKRPRWGMGVRKIRTMNWRVVQGK